MKLNIQRRLGSFALIMVGSLLITNLMRILKNMDLFTKSLVLKLLNQMVLQNGKIATSLKLLVLFYSERMCLTTIGLMLSLQQYTLLTECLQRFLNLKLRYKLSLHLYHFPQYKCCHLESLVVLRLFIYIKTNAQSLILVLFGVFFWDMVYTKKGIVAMTLLLDTYM